MQNKLNKEIFSQNYDGLIDADILLQLPEKVIQFGSGVLLRGLPDFYIDHANKQGKFNGRIVIVKTTGQGGDAEFADQDYLYTHIIKGSESNKLVEYSLINSSISRMLHAGQEWEEILKCAENESINIVISNTTEQGLVYLEEKIDQKPPKSYPAKLLAYIYHRFLSIGNDDNSKLVVIPTELVESNGKVLKSLIDKLISFNGLTEDFVLWYENNVIFCNSLVDRIVPGKPDSSSLAKIQQDLGYADSFLIVSEPYNLWAIEGPESIVDTIQFARCNEGIKVVNDIAIYKELKLRLLNAAHTFTAGLALNHGLQTVYAAMSNNDFKKHIFQLIEDIKASIHMEIDSEIKNKFGQAVLDRFSNPYIEHLWSSIIFSFTEKFKIRCIPLMINHYHKYGTFPETMVSGLAAYLAVAIPDYVKDNEYYRELAGQVLKLNDQKSEELYNKKLSSSITEVVDYQLGQFFPNFDKDTLAELNKTVLTNMNSLLQNQE